MSKNLASKAISGLKWSSVATAANAVMQIGYTSAMGRLLEPEAFGLVALSAVILRFGSYFANLGLNKAIIQKEELEQNHIRAAFTSSILLGLVFTALIWALAPYILFLFDDNPEVVPIVRVMSLSFLISSVSATSVSLLERNMQFKLVSIVETLSYVIAYLGVGILLAYLGYGVWSLVLASLAQATFVAIGSYAVVRHNILLHFSWTSYKPLFKYGSKMSFISFLEFLSTDLITVVIGKQLGSYKLGIYDRAHRLVSLPMYMLTRTISKVVFPSFSKLQSEKEKLGKVYLSSITLIAAIVIPICLGIMVAAPEIVYVVLGDQWGESIPVLQLLSLAIPLGFITMFAGIVCDAKAELNSKLVLNTVYIILLCGLFYLFRQYGLVGFAFAMFLGQLVRIFMYQRVMHTVLGLTYKQQASIYIPGVINGALIAGGIYLVSYMLRSEELPNLLILAAQMITGGILLLVLTLLFPHKLLRTEIQMIMAKFGVSASSNKYYGRIIHHYKNHIVKEA